MKSGLRGCGCMHQRNQETSSRTERNSYFQDSPCKYAQASGSRGSRFARYAWILLQPKSIGDLVSHIVGKVLDQFGIEHNIFKRWSQN